MESFSASARIGKKVESGTTEEAAKVEKFITERLTAMSDEHLMELRTSVSLAFDALNGGPDAHVILERGVRGAGLFLLVAL